jgi:hypothetical protein
MVTEGDRAFNLLANHAESRCDRSCPLEIDDCKTLLKENNKKLEPVLLTL